MKKAASIVMVAAMLAAVAPNTFAATSWGDTQVDADSTVTKAVIEFEVPTAMSIGLDAFSLTDATGSQIYSPSFPIINKSNVPIAVSVTADMNGSAADVEFQSSVAGTTPANAQDTEKRAYVEMVNAKALVVDPDNTTPAKQDASDKTKAVAGTVQFKDPEYAANSFTETGAKDMAKVALHKTYKAEMDFALQKAAYVDKITATPPSGEVIFDSVAKESEIYTGATAFRFMGALNPYAAWADSDVKIAVTFSVYGQTPAMYTEALKTKVANGLNLVSAVNPKNAVSVSSGNPISLNSAAAADATLVFDMGYGADAASAIGTIKLGTAALTATDFAFDADTSTLTLRTGTTAVMKKFTDAKNKSVSKVTITMKMVDAKAPAAVIEVPFTIS